MFRDVGRKHKRAVCWLRFGSQDHLREAFWGGAPDLDSLRSDVSAACTERRWNSIGSLASENSLLPPANSLGPQQLVAQLFPNLSAIDSQTLLHSIQLLSQVGVALPTEALSLFREHFACSVYTLLRVQGLVILHCRDANQPGKDCSSCDLPFHPPHRAALKDVAGRPSISAWFGTSALDMYGALLAGKRDGCSCEQ